MRSWMLCGGVCSLVVMVACERPSPVPPEYVVPPPRGPEVQLDTPEAAVRSLVHLLERHLGAVAARDRFGGIRARDQIAWHVAAPDVLFERYRSSPVGYEDEKAVVLATLVESWAACLNYYAGGVALERMFTEFRNERGAALRIPAYGPDGDEAVLRVAVQRDRDETWHVVGVEFVTPAQVRKPATAPAAPASRPES